MSYTARPYKSIGRIIIWRNKTIAKSAVGHLGGHASSTKRVIVYPTRHKALSSIPRGLGG